MPFTLSRRAAWVEPARAADQFQDLADDSLAPGVYMICRHLADDGRTHHHAIGDPGDGIGLLGRLRMPKPTVQGRAVTARTRARASRTSSSGTALVPVTPATET